MEATCSSETSVDIERTTGHYIVEDITFLYDNCMYIYSEKYLIMLNVATSLKNK
jgi:hypothetical protein